MLKSEYRAYTMHTTLINYCSMTQHNKSAVNRLNKTDNQRAAEIIMNYKIIFTSSTSNVKHSSSTKHLLKSSCLKS